MAAKQVYTVRLHADQVTGLEAMADKLGLSISHLIRSAVDDYLRQERERNYLDEVRADIVTAVNRLGRQVEKDRAEQQYVMAMLDYQRKFISYALPAPIDSLAANQILEKREKHFIDSIPLLFANKSRAKVTEKIQKSNLDLSDEESNSEQLHALEPESEFHSVASESVSVSDKIISQKNVDLAVPFVEKDFARAAGAKWDKERKTFYAPAGTNLSLLEKWISK